MLRFQGTSATVLEIPSPDGAMTWASRTWPFQGLARAAPVTAITSTLSGSGRSWRPGVDPHHVPDRVVQSCPDKEEYPESATAESATSPLDNAKSCAATSCAASDNTTTIRRQLAWCRYIVRRREFTLLRAQRRRRRHSGSPNRAERTRGDRHRATARCVRVRHLDAPGCGTMRRYGFGAFQPSG
jgi:hypothetical protein